MILGRVHRSTLNSRGGKSSLLHFRIVDVKQKIGAFLRNLPTALFSLFTKAYDENKTTTTNNKHNTSKVNTSWTNRVYRDGLLAKAQDSGNGMG